MRIEAMFYRAREIVCLLFRQKEDILYAREIRGPRVRSLCMICMAVTQIRESLFQVPSSALCGRSALA